MSNFKTAEAYRELLKRYDGIRVGKIRCHPSGNDSVWFQASNPASLDRLASCAQNANVSILVWSNSQGPPIKEPGAEFDEGPWYEIRATEEPSGVDRYLSKSENFCGRLMYDLTRRGVVDESEGNRLMAIWGWPSEE
jgi:hypothetical protein